MNADLQLSVILTNYNDSKLIRGALDAICNQSYRPFEVIVVDDGSTDESIKVIEQAISTYSIIRLVKNEKNRGITYSARRGLQEAKGDIVTFTACDDRTRPGLYEAGMRLLEQYPQAGLFSSDTRVNVPVHNHSYDARQGWLQEPGYLSPGQFVSILYGGGIHTNTVLVRRNIVNRITLYPEQLRWHADWWTFHVIAFRHGICYSPQILADYTFDHAGSFSSGMYDLEEQTLILCEVIRLALDEEHADVLDSIIKSRFMAPHFPRVVTLEFLQQVLKDYNYNESSKKLVYHLAMETLHYNFGIKTMINAMNGYVSQHVRNPLLMKFYHLVYKMRVAAWYRILPRYYDVSHAVYWLYFHSYHSYAGVRDKIIGRKDSTENGELREKN